jgi:hypothetical protein
MLIKEMFSSTIADSVTTDDINWPDDLKFFIDNDDKMLENYVFPAVKKHSDHLGHPDAWKLYLPGIKKCKEAYCAKFDIVDADEKFAPPVLEDLAKQFAAAQETFIKQGDYDATK